MGSFEETGTASCLGVARVDGVPESGVQGEEGRASAEIVVIDEVPGNEVAVMLNVQQRVRAGQGKADGDTGIERLCALKNIRDVPAGVVDKRGGDGGFRSLRTRDFC